MLIRPIRCQDNQSQIMGRGHDPKAADNMAAIPGWEESGSSQEVYPMDEELAEVVSRGRHWRQHEGDRKED